MTCAMGPVPWAVPWAVCCKLCAMGCALGCAMGCAMGPVPAACPGRQAGSRPCREEPGRECRGDWKGMPGRWRAAGAGRGHSERGQPGAGGTAPGLSYTPHILSSIGSSSGLGNIRSLLAHFIPGRAPECSILRPRQPSTDLTDSKPQSEICCHQMFQAVRGGWLGFTYLVEKTAFYLFLCQLSAPSFSLYYSC